MPDAIEQKIDDGPRQEERRARFRPPQAEVSPRIVRDQFAVDLNDVSGTLYHVRDLPLGAAFRPALDEIMRNSRNETEALVGVREWIEKEYAAHKEAFRFLKSAHTVREQFEKLDWQDYAIIRLLDYIEHAGREYPDLNLRGEIAVSNPIKLIWLAVHRGTGGAKPDFFIDMIELFRQLRGESKPYSPSREKVEEWMDRYPSGLDPRIVALREENRERIMKILIRRIEEGERGQRYYFKDGMSEEKQRPLLTSNP